jgi:hypothetical protein
MKIDIKQVPEPNYEIIISLSESEALDVINAAARVRYAGCTGLNEFLNRLVQAADNKIPYQKPLDYLDIPSRTRSYS